MANKCPHSPNALLESRLCESARLMCITYLADGWWTFLVLYFHGMENIRNTNIRKKNVSSYDHRIVRKKDVKGRWMFWWRELWDDMDVLHTG